MNPEVYHQFSAIEDSHWWFSSRRDLIEKIFSTQNLERGGKGLDIGCGTGGNLPLLEKFCEEVVGLDISDTALDLAREKWPRYRFVKGDAQKVSDYFPPGEFSVITVLNVLYHQWVKSEGDIITQIHQLLRPGGLLILTEPAFPLLTRKHDEQVMGKKRYKLVYFKKILTQGRFKVSASTYFNMVSFFPALGLALLGRWQRKDKSRSKGEVGEVQMPHPLLNGCLKMIMKMERLWISRFRSVPLGVTLLCMARKE